MHTHFHFLHVLYFLGTHLKWLPILHTLMRVLSCIVCCHAILPHHLLSPSMHSGHNNGSNGTLLQCPLSFLQSACTPSTSIASGAAASGAAAAAAAAGLAAHSTRILCCWLCWGLAEEAKHALLAMFGSLACLPFPSALLSMLIPVKAIAELPFTTHHWAFQVVHDDISNGMLLSSKFKSSQFLDRST